LSKFTVLNKINVKFVRQLFLVVFLAITITGLYAQESRAKKDKKSEKRERINARLKLEEEGEPAFKKYNLLGVQANSDGYGIAFEKGKYKTTRQSLWYRVELNERRHPKEKKAVGIDIISGRVNSLIFGKSNNFYQLKLGFGKQQLVGGKANKNGVSVSAIYGGGLTFGLLKPYLIDARLRLDARRVRVQFDSIYRNPDDYDLIDGAAGFTSGWKQLKVRPGVHAKAAIRFDYSRFSETITAIEAGVNIEYYLKKSRQMVEINPRNSFFNAYVAIGFGRRK
jgi:hypothetical protein